MTAPVSLFKDFSGLSLGHTLGAAFMGIIRRWQSELIDGVEVRGRAVFRARTREALAPRLRPSLRTGAPISGACLACVRGGA